MDKVGFGAFPGAWGAWFNRAGLERLRPLAVLGFCVLAAGLLALESLFGWDERLVHGLVGLALAGAGGLTVFSRAGFSRGPSSVSRVRPGVLPAASIPATWKDLLREKEAAVNANRAKSRYLANVSHEIRSPLNAIYGYAQLVERGDPVNPREAAKVIRRCSEHLTCLVEGLLDISQVENGVLRVQTEASRFPKFLDHLVGMMRPSAEAKGLELVYEPIGRLPELVRMDQNRLRQVLINLISNAIKFTDEGSVTLRVRYSGQIARFEVIDTGPGIAPEDQERIFAPFERAGDEGQQCRPGAGLGLPISKAMVEILGGNLELSSTPGKGSNFRVTMMLGDVAGHLVDEGERPRVISYQGARRSILLADDDREQRDFMETLLISLDFEVTAVPNGETALELAQHRQFDLAILDISMPGMSGWETASELRRRQKAGLKIMMLSANSEEFHHPGYRKPVHDHFLSKPVKFSDLSDAIAGLLELGWVHAPAAAQPDGGKAPAAPEGREPGEAARLGETGLVHVQRLKELLRIGYVRGIEAEIRSLAEAQPQADALAGQLYDCLDRFDLVGMSHVLEAI